MQPAIDRARRLMANASSIVVLGHERPDGDSVGSMLALMLMLRQRGQAAVTVSATGIPGRFNFLPGANEVLETMPDGEHLLLAVDSADAERLSAPVSEPVAVNFDHHPTNTRYAEVNLVYPEAASTTQVLFDLSSELDLPLNPDIAASLLAGLITDTLGFRTPSVTPEVLRTAAELVEHGVDLSAIYQLALVEHSFAALRYWGSGLSSLNRRGGLVWASLSLEERRRVGYPGSDDADLVELLGTVREAQVSLIFVEQPEGRVKVSWRAREGVDVAEVAAEFGGGGHHLASGATVDGELEAVIEKVVESTQRALEQNSS